MTPEFIIGAFVVFVTIAFLAGFFFLPELFGISKGAAGDEGSDDTKRP